MLFDGSFEGDGGLLAIDLNLVGKFSVGIRKMSNDLKIWEMRGNGLEGRKGNS